MKTTCAIYWRRLVTKIRPTQGEERMISSSSERKVNRLVHKYLAYVLGSDIVDLDELNRACHSSASAP